MKAMFKILFFFMVTLNFYVTTTAQADKVNSTDFTPIINKYRKIILSEMLKHKTIGVSIALVNGDSIIWAEAFGYKDLKHNIKTTISDQFLIGSITKTFTGIGVMQLQQNSKLNIDDPLKKYLPEFNIKMLSGNINEIKIRQIMAHHSGIPGDIVGSLFSKIPENMDKIIEYINKEYTSFTPDVSYSYSNEAISLLGSVIERVSGIKYTEYITDNIFKPLKMSSTGFFTATDKPDGVSFAYDYKGKLSEELPVTALPAGGIYSNVKDMSNYMITILNYGKYKNTRIVDSVQLCKMFEVQNADIPLDLGRKIGLIWFIDYTNAGKIIKHDGATLYQCSRMMIAPECKLGIIMLSNSDNFNVSDEAGKILGEAAKLTGFKPVSIPSKDSLSEHNITLLTKSNFKKIKLPSVQLSKYTGIYSNPYTYYNIKSSGSELYTCINERKTYLEPITDNNFRLKIKILGLKPKFLNKNIIVYFDTIQGEKVFISQNPEGLKNLLGVKQGICDISKPWLNRLGKYKIVSEYNSIYGLLTSTELKMQDGIIFLSGKRVYGKHQKIKCPLTILNDTLAQASGYGRSAGNKLQILYSQHGTEYIRFHGMDFVKIKK